MRGKPTDVEEESCFRIDFLCLQFLFPEEDSKEENESTCEDNYGSASLSGGHTQSIGQACEDAEEVCISGSSSATLSFMERQHLHRSGATLVELLLFTGVIAVMAGAIVSFSLFSRGLGTRNELIAEVEQNGSLVVQRILQEVQNADLIAYPPPGEASDTLVLVRLNPLPHGPIPHREIVIQLFHDRLRFIETEYNAAKARMEIKENAFLTTMDVGVDQLSFLHLSAGGSDEGLSFSLRVFNKEAGAEVEENLYYRQFRSTTSLRPSHACSSNANCTTSPYSTCCDGVCRQACLSGCTADTQCNTTIGEICCVSAIVAGTKSCNLPQNCQKQCVTVDDCPRDAPFCQEACKQRIPTCDNGICTSLYAGSCATCSWCGDGYIDRNGSDDAPGTAEIDDDSDGVIDNEAEILSPGTDDEECDDGCILPNDPPGCDNGPPYNDTNACSNTCRAQICGDGVIHAGMEECDDGNLQVGDGCDETCKTEVICSVAQLDVVFVIDTSGSMQWGDRLDAAKIAVKKFLDYMDFPKDQAAIISFGDTGAVRQALTSNETNLKNAVDALSAAGGTNIQHGLELGRGQLSASTAELKILILLSDGGPNRKTAASTSCAFAPPPDDACGVIAEATVIKSPPLDAKLFAIGLGVDDNARLLLQEVASDPDSLYYLFAPTTKTLADSYMAITDAICECNSTQECQNDSQCAPGFTCPSGKCVLPGQTPCGDGNDVNNDDCPNHCFQPVCGDGATSPNPPADEQCDDGGKCPDGITACTVVNAATTCGGGACTPQNNDGCSSGCRFEPLCGNRKKEALEKCDDGGVCDGGTAHGMPCTKNWTNPNADCGVGGVCMTKNLDGCDTSCQKEETLGAFCHIGGEPCFVDADCNSSPTVFCGDCGGGCDTTYRGQCSAGACTIKKCPFVDKCPSPACCNRKVEQYEQCDDGKRCDNLSGVKSGELCKVDADCAGGSCFGFNGDGCSNACTSATTAVCGDGNIDPGEACDDGKRCTNNGNPCTVDADCTPGVCRGFSSDGCRSPQIGYAESLDDALSGIAELPPELTVTGAERNSVLFLTASILTLLALTVGMGMFARTASVMPIAFLALVLGTVMGITAGKKGWSPIGTVYVQASSSSSFSFSSSSSSFSSPSSSSFSSSSGSAGMVCGNGSCVGAENCSNCPSDCKCPLGNSCSAGVCTTSVATCQPEQVCGDGIVQGTETCDDGGFCNGGAYDGTTCPVDTSPFDDTDRDNDIAERCVATGGICVKQPSACPIGCGVPGSSSSSSGGSSSVGGPSSSSSSSGGSSSSMGASSSSSS